MEKNTRVFSPEVLLEEYRQLLQDETIDALPFVRSVYTGMTKFVKR